MNYRALYNIILHTVVAPSLILAYGPRVLLKGKYSRSIKEKFGILPAVFKVPEKRPLIWLHAVSVGEAVALNPLVKSLKKAAPEIGIIVSTGTETGRDKAEELMPEVDAFLFLPLDYPECINSVVNLIRPDVFVLMETELWPNLICSLKRVGSRVILANGRISDRSFPRYKKLKFFFAEILQMFDLLLMSSHLDAERIIAMGALGSHVSVTGNTKFDAAPVGLTDNADSEMRNVLQISDSERVFVAGSVHPKEYEIIIDTFLRIREKHEKLTLVLVPRHVERTPEISEYVRQRFGQFPFLRSSVDDGGKRNGNPFIILDTTGELFKTYSIGEIIFVGGSLVKRGGQNIVEPAAWGKPIIIGPSMEDFREAKELLSRVGAAHTVSSGEELYFQICRMLDDPESFRKYGELGKRIVADQIGSADRNAEHILGLLKECRTDITRV